MEKIKIHKQLEGEGDYVRVDGSDSWVRLKFHDGRESVSFWFELEMAGERSRARRSLTSIADIVNSALAHVDASQA